MTTRSFSTDLRQMTKLHSDFWSNVISIARSRLPFASSAVVLMRKMSSRIPCSRCGRIAGNGSTGARSSRHGCSVSSPTGASICIDLHRLPRADNVDAVPEPADAQPDVVSTMQRNEVTQMLENAMQRLPEQQRVAVILSYHENMSNGEIAEVMDTTVAAVESLLKRGRQQLKDLLRRHERDIRGAFTDC